MQSIPISSIQNGIIENIPVSRIFELSINGHGFSFRIIKDNISYDFELCDSIQNNGLLVPIIVRLTPSNGFEVISGNRRLRAFKRLGLRKILCHVITADDKKAIEIMLSENIHFKQINPIEEATLYKKYIDEFGWGGISDLAKKISKSVTYVDRRIKFLTLSEELIADIDSGMIKPSLADELVTIKDEEKRSYLAELIRKRSPSLREFRRISKNDELLCTESDVISWNNEYLDSSMINDEEKAQRSFDQAIMALRFSLDKLSSIMDNIDDNWLVHESLMQHKWALSHRIDILYKEKKKLRY